MTLGDDVQALANWAVEPTKGIILGRDLLVVRYYPLGDVHSKLLEIGYLAKNGGYVQEGFPRVTQGDSSVTIHRTSNVDGVVVPYDGQDKIGYVLDALFKKS